MEFLKLKKNLQKDFSGFKKIKLALLGDSATQLLVQAVRGAGYEAQLDIEIFEGDYDQIDRNLLDFTSDLYKFKPEFLMVFNSAPKLLKKFYKIPRIRQATFAQDLIQETKNRLELATSKLDCKVIIANIPEINDSVFGNFANKIDSSFLYQIRKFNLELMELSQRAKNLSILDICALQNYYGERFVIDPKIYATADMVFSIDFLPIVARHLTSMLKTATGRFLKCLILDLDNTLWGGIIGDDGMENIRIGDLGIGKVFSEFQSWCKQLSQRGIMLAVCSQNEESIAKEPFEKHPDMVLRLNDIAIFVANRNNKVDNIKYIREILNIGFDAIAFLDDNPFERNLVRTYLPEVVVPELPDDPADYLTHLRALHLFETASFVQADTERTKQYQEEAKRQTTLKAFANEEEFLASLEMISEVKPFEKFNIPRAAQLTQRSNQFNLRTVRYTEQEIENIARSPDHFTFTFTLKDKFGDSGLISVVILKKLQGDYYSDNNLPSERSSREGVAPPALLVEGATQAPTKALFIDTWVMSCRVLKRGMEDFIVRELVDFTDKIGFNFLVGEYLPTPKNGLTKDLYKNSGFDFRDGLWRLAVEKYEPRKNYIRRAE